MSKRIYIAVIVVLGITTVFLAGLASPVLAGDDPGVGALGAPVLVADHGPEASPDVVSTSVMRMPLYFIENQGQLDEQVAYYVQGQDKTLYFTPQGVTFVLRGSAPPVIASEAKQSPAPDSSRLPRLRLAMTEDDEEPADSAPQRWVVKLDFVGANPDVLPVGQDETGALISYFTGRPDEWKTGLRTYSRVVYRHLWPGIDLEYSGTVNELKYQFIVQPGADPSHIKLAYRGASDVAVNGAGQLEVTTPAGGFHDGTPYGYQQTEGGKKVEVGLSYKPLGGGGERHLYGFQVGAYDPRLPLVLDPVILVYCGFIGGSDSDAGWDIAVDGDGHAYVVGDTYSTAATFPVGVGPDVTHNGDVDAFVAKVSADGTALEYCGYIGGSSRDRGLGIAVDGTGQAYVTGSAWSTESEGFPVTVGPDLTHSGGIPGEAFVAKVNKKGTGLVYCGYIGGLGGETGRGIAVDSAGSAYVAGHTWSTEHQRFPVTVGPDLTYNGGDTDAFVAKVNKKGTALVYCGYIGGSGLDAGYGIAVDVHEQAYVTGETNSAETEGFPVTVGPDLTHNGSVEAFVTKVSTDGAALVYSGYIGGSGGDVGNGIAVDSKGQAYVAGSTSSSQTAGFPVTVGPDLTYNDTASLSDAFVAKVMIDGNGLSYCGYIGGSGQDIGEGIAVDGSGCAHVVGWTASDESEGFPLNVGPDLTHNGVYDAFVARLFADGTALAYCGYIGGSEQERGLAIAVDAWGGAYVGGYTYSGDGTFPVVTGPDTTHNGGNLDAFVAKVKWNYRPMLGAILPSSGSGPTGVTEYFRTTWSDPNGRDDLKQCYFHIGSTPTLAGNVTLLYHARKNKLWMLADDGSTWTGGHEPGTATTLENSQATVDCELTTTGGSGDTLSVTWAIEFKPGYTGPKKTGLMCKDIHKARAKGAWKGTWTITP
jgi:hypothetical protein